LYPHPMRAVNTGQWVVWKHIVSVGSGTDAYYFHHYEGGIEDIQRGFLGFNVHTIGWRRLDGTDAERRMTYDNSRQRSVDPFVCIPVTDTTIVRDGHGKIVHKTVHNQKLAAVQQRLRDLLHIPGYEHDDRIRSGRQRIVAVNIPAICEMQVRSTTLFGFVITIERRQCAQKSGRRWRQWRPPSRSPSRAASIRPLA
jgi:hypothetical protein